jgi:hypothetical protein
VMNIAGKAVVGPVDLGGVDGGHVSPSLGWGLKYA